MNAIDCVLMLGSRLLSWGDCISRSQLLGLSLLPLGVSSLDSVLSLDSPLCGTGVVPVLLACPSGVSSGHSWCVGGWGRCDRDGVDSGKEKM